MVQLNGWIKNFAENNGCVYLDYFTTMSDDRHGLKAELIYDSVHPNLVGYKVMKPLVESAISMTLSRY